MFLFRKKKKEKKRGDPTVAVIGALARRKGGRKLIRAFVRKCRQLGLKPSDVIASFMINFISGGEQYTKQAIKEYVSELAESVKQLSELKETLDTIFGSRPASEKLLSKLLDLAPLIISSKSAKIEVEEE